MIGEARPAHGFHRGFLWRVAGLPCELLEQFALDGLAADVKPAVVADGHLAWAPWWHEHAYDISAAGRNEEFDAAFDALRRALAEVAVDPLFQSSVAYSSPQAAVLLARHEWVSGRPRRSKQKRRELLVMRYLQRFVTKCETAARVGPSVTGRFTRVPDKVDYRFDPSTYAPQVLVSDRLLSALADHFRRVPDVVLQVAVRRCSGMAFRGDSAVVHPAIGEITLNTDSLTVLRAAAEPVRVADLRDAVGCSTEQLLLIVYGLVRLRLLSDEFAELHRGAHPIDRLRGIVRRGSPSIASATADLFRAVDDIVDNWSVVDSAGKAALLDAMADAFAPCGIHLGRPEGQFYGDHLAVVEDGPCPGSGLEIDVEWAAPVLAELEVAVRAALASDDGAGHVVTSPDVMIVAPSLEAVRSGAFSLVLAECHSAVGPAGFQSRVIEDPDAWLASISEFLRSRLAPDRPLQLTAVPTNKTWYCGPLPGVTYLEVGSPAPDGAERVDLGDLEIGCSDRGATVRTTAGDATFALLPNGRGLDGPGSPLAGLRLPRFTPDPDVGPRETTGRVVRKRAAWRLVADGLPAGRADPFEVFVWAQRVRAQYDLPRWIFVRPDDERKPMCVDFSNPFLCEELVRSMRTSSPLRAEEMLPSPDDAWVVSPMGRHLSELRLLYAAPA